MQRRIIAVMVLLCLIAPAGAAVSPALEAVKGHADAVLAVLRDPALKPESAKELKKEKIRAIAQKMFDFTELSKRTLAREWSKFSPEQQKEFVSLYRSLLEDAYANKILSYSNEKIVFSREVPLSDSTAEVRSSVTRNSAEIPIYYRAMLKDGEWRVYDVVIEGVSLINNYRSQFRDILAKKSRDALLEELRKKVGKKT